MSDRLASASSNTALSIAHNDVIYMMHLVLYMLFHPCSALPEHYMQLCIRVATMHEQYSKLVVAIWRLMKFCLAGKLHQCATPCSAVVISQTPFCTNMRQHHVSE